MKKRNKNLIILSITTIILLIAIGVLYVIYLPSLTGEKKELIVVKYTESNQIIIDKDSKINYVVNPVMKNQTYEEDTRNELSKCVDYSIHEFNPMSSCKEEDSLIMKFQSYEKDTRNELSKCVDQFSNVNNPTVLESYCKGIGKSYGETFQEYIERQKGNCSFLEDKNIVLSNLEDVVYLEFTISGKNTYEKKDIWYDIILDHGDSHITRTKRIDDEYLKFTLVEIKDGVETIVKDNVSYNSLTHRIIYSNKIDNNTSKVDIKYRLYIADNSYDNLDKFASVKVNVVGSLSEKTSDLDLNEKDGNSYLNWDLVIKNLSELINYTEIHFIKLSENEINNVINTNNYNNLNIYNNTVYDVAYNKNSNVKMWTTISNDGYHIMYVATPCDVLYFTNASSMFSDMITLKKISFGDNGLIIDTSKVKDMSDMFNGCESLTSLDLSSFDTSNVEDMSSMFSYCSQLTSLDLSSFDTSKVKNMSYMFVGQYSLTSLNLSSFDTSNVIDMRSMFDWCSSLTSLDLSSFDTSNVEDMSEMFNQCDSLTSLDLSSFDTSKVEDMFGMFSYCSQLTSLDLSSFNTSKVEDMSDMFNHCDILTSLDLSNFDTSNVEDMSRMFLKCESLTSLDLSKFTFDSVINAAYLLDVPSNILIYVKDEKAKEWVLNNETSDLPESNIIIKK